MKVKEMGFVPLAVFVKSVSLRPISGSNPILAVTDSRCSDDPSALA